MTEAEVVKHLESLPVANQEAAMTAVADLCPHCHPSLTAPTPVPSGAGNVGAFNWAALLQALPQLAALLAALFGGQKPSA